MASIAEPVVTAAPVVVHRPWWRGKLVQVAGIVALMYVAYRVWALDYPWPNSLVWNNLSFRLDEFQIWLLDERGKTDQGLVFTVFEGFSSTIDHLVDWFTRFLLWMTWLGTTIAGVALVLRFGGVRAASITLFAFATFALTGLWEESMQTFALMLVAVLLSLLVGIPLGVVAGRSDRFNRAITPILDAMQIVPAFAYLMPVVILFSIGPAAAIVSTMIYAIPPAIRITALGIRGVPVNTVEAATSLGSTRSQLLRKVQLPLARRLILLGVNQMHSLRAVDGRHRRTHRRRRARRRRHERPVLEPGARAPRRLRHRRDGDGARPLDRGDRGPHGPGPAAPRRGPPTAAPAPDGRDVRRHRRGHRGREGARSRRDLPGRGRRPPPPRHARVVAPGEDPGRSRLRAGPDDVGIRDHRARRDLHPPAAAPAAPGVPRRRPVVHHGRRAHGNRLRRRAARGRR